MLRVVLPGGVAMTYQWADEAEAMPQIKAAMAALRGGIAVVAGAGDDEWLTPAPPP